MLFHYHFWTPYVEEMENFYKSCGFRISTRIGKYNGEFEQFNPPLTWDDFRDKQILFRIIEARKSTINITFGYGKKIIFDHIGFLVSKEECETICKQAEKLHWKVTGGERRTFIRTPYGFRIELQTHLDAIDDNESIEELQKIIMTTKQTGLEQDLSFLFHKEIKSIETIRDNKTALKHVYVNSLYERKQKDPNGVEIYV
ncbi:VOC family protein [Bacillus sp. C1]